MQRFRPGEREITQHRRRHVAAPNSERFVKHVSPALDPCIPEAEEIDENWNGLGAAVQVVCCCSISAKDAPYASDDSDDSDYPGLDSMPCSDSEIG